ncbi:MAG: alpha/beta hydrolase [Bryobacterales bacterium]|nr:alpha/beta hydrolase [Bryobacterales bacterium]
MPHLVVICRMALMASLACGMAAQTPREPIPESTPYVYRTVGGTSLDLQVLSPPASFARPRPAIVYFFGGGWSSGTVKQFLPFGKELVGRGMVAVFVDYRVSSRHKSTVTDATADAQAAMRYVRANAAKLGIHPNRIVAAGGSAGGQLALATTLVPPLEEDAVSPAANLLIGYNPVADLRDERWTSRFGEAGAKVSPISFVKAGVPATLIFHGVDDPTVPIKQVRDFCAAMRKAGNSCTLEESEGATHGFFNYGRHENRWYTETLAKTIVFLKAQGYLE